MCTSRKKKSHRKHRHKKETATDIQEKACRERCCSLKHIFIKNNDVHLNWQWCFFLFQLWELVCALLLTLRAAASACAFRMLLFSSSGVRRGVATGLLLPALLRPHFSVSFTTSSCSNRVGDGKQNSLTKWKQYMVKNTFLSILMLNYSIRYQSIKICTIDF